MRAHGAAWQAERDRNALAVTLADVRKEQEAERQEAARRQAQTEKVGPGLML